MRKDSDNFKYLEPHKKDDTDKYARMTKQALCRAHTPSTLTFFGTVGSQTNTWGTSKVLPVFEPRIV